jgi:methyl-accepting chemotaxis protein
MRKIRNNILFTMMLLTVLPTLLIGSYSFYTSTEALRESALKDQHIQLLIIQQRLNNYLIKQDATLSNHQNEVPSYFSDKQVLAGLQGVLQNFSEQQPLSSSIYLLDAATQEVAYIESKSVSSKGVEEARDSFDLLSFKGSKSNKVVESSSEIGLSVPIFIGEAASPQGYLVSISDKSHVFKPLQDYLFISLIIIGICLLLSFLFAIILSNSLSEPLLRLTDKVKSFSQGDLETPIETDAKNEIGDLSQAMELLRKSMVILMKRSRKV